MTEAELAALYDRHADALFACLLPVLRDESDVRDVLQDLFVDLARHPERLTGVRDERAFLLRWVHHRAIDLIRRRSTRDRHTVRAGEEAVALQPFVPASDPDEAAFRDQLAAALETLPPEQRVVIQLKLWERLTFDEIARVLDLPPNTAASRYRYGMDKLRLQLRPLYEEIQGSTP